jgi:hypothetical protein
MRTLFIQSFAQVLQELSPNFRDDLEGKTMKAARGGEGVVEATINNVPVWNLHPMMGVLFGSYSNISRCADIESPNIDFIKRQLRNPKFIGEGDQPQTYRKNTNLDEKDVSWSTLPITSDPNLIDFLVQSGRIKIQEFSSARKGVPSACQISLYNPEKETYTSFVWTKEMENTNSGYCTAIYPVFGYDPDQKAIRIMSPLEHLGLWLSRHFTCSVNITSPKYVDKMFSNGGVNALKAAIQRYVELFGDNIPTEFINGVHIAYKVPAFFASYTVCIDHSSFTKWNSKWSEHNMKIVTRRCNEDIGGICLPAHGKHVVARKHFLAEKDGLPKFVVREDGIVPCQGHRPGRNRSLLIRCNGVAKLKVAIVSSGTIQCFLTPSGIDKTAPKIDTFLPQISYVEQEGFEPTTQYDWAGNQSFIWQTPNAKQDAKKVPKLLCPNGSRFEPQECYQHVTESGENVDLIYSLEELKDKQLEHIFLSKSKEEVIINVETGQRITTQTLEWIFYRSGVASENIQPRILKQFSVQGFTGLILEASLEQANLRYHKFNWKSYRKGRKLLEQSKQLLSLPYVDRETD